MKKVTGILIVIAAICLVVYSNFFTVAAKRQWKTTKSNFTGGIDRVVTLYDYQGNVIRQWEGKFDLSDSQTEFFFDDQNGKRVIIHGGIAVAEEK